MKSEKSKNVSSLFEMSKIVSFFKVTKLRTIIIMLLIVAIFLSFIAGIAIWRQVAALSPADDKHPAGALWVTFGSTHKMLGLALFIISLSVTMFVVAYFTTCAFNSSLKKWKETEQAYGVTSLVYLFLLIIFSTMLPLTLALH